MSTPSASAKDKRRGLDDDADGAHAAAGEAKKRMEERGGPAGLGIRGAGGEADVGAERVKGAAREVEDLLHAEDDLQPRRHQKQNARVEHAAHHEVDDVSGHTKRALRSSRS